MKKDVIGKLVFDDLGDIELLEREYHGQGYVFKDYGGIDSPNTVCYVPELHTTLYTFNDILELCDYDMVFAKDVFEDLNWQSPEVLIEECLQDEEYMQELKNRA